MEQSFVVYDNPQFNVKIVETPDKLILTCPKSVSESYGSHFSPSASKQSGLEDIWIFNKNDLASMKVLSTMITTPDITKMFKLQQFPMMFQTPTPIVPVTPVADPKLILKVVWQSQDGKTSIVDYTPNSIALFSPKEVTDPLRGHLSQLNAKFNARLAQNPERTVTGAGWILFKNSDTYNFLKQLTGTDIQSLTVPAPEKKAWRGADPVSPQKGILMQGGLAPSQPQMPFSAGNPPLPQQIQTTPAHHLANIVSSLAIPMAQVQSILLPHVTGDTRMGIWGPSDLVDQEIDKIFSNYDPEHYGTKIISSLSIGDNKVVIIDRYAAAI